ncbi:hypothetical protein [Photorhabdus heterorhabditis]|uniref:hypothetical protein n=2 Tax=Photorhabdus heterorhabditis TaxID=880156 RepID=UPI000A8304DC
MAASMTKEKKFDGWNNEKFDGVFVGSSSISEAIQQRQMKFPATFSMEIYCFLTKY